MSYEGDDAEQQGITLTPITSGRQIMHGIAQAAVDRHATACQFANLHIEKRVRSLETGYARLTGFMVGSGFLGGATAAVVAKLLSH